ncbi:TonB family protein [Accumulibacter sp.]|uniref:energy transducer TonB n=1 Tax=Accumulibacter sp. TaxID=2053492 RepID=UPI0025C51F0E|nr:TonB family protein [Accumulibacter sp.]
MNAVLRDRYRSPLAARRLWLAMAISLLLHGVLLAVHFSFPDASRAFQEQALDIILVNSRSPRKPAEAQVLAQTNLDGGGNTEQVHRATTPLPPAPRHQDGDDLEHSQRRVQELEAHQQRLAARARSRTVVAAKPDKEEQPTPTPEPAISGRDLAHSALAMARLEGAIDKELNEYNQRPRKKFIGTRATEYRFAQYIEAWRSKVERVGTLNYPDAARGKLYGTLVMTVSIKSDGSLAGIEINRSSGHRILDDAARRIVTMAAPYGDFPPAIQHDTDILVFTRSLRFTQSDSLESKK